ncbi:MAG: shikimate dehydrogenase [Saprospiraceae bacterium]
MKKFGLIGFPLSHSFSKKYFLEKFQKENIQNCEYELYPIESISELPALIDRIGSELVGLNVTIPYKNAVIPYLDELSIEAESIHAVNTILFKSGKKYGFNTDIPGFEDCLLSFIPEKCKHALIFGNGGAARAVKYVLEKNKIDFTVVSRTAYEHQISYSDITSTTLKGSKLIINTTPLGMYPKVDTFPEIDYSFISKDHYLFDLVYNPAKTLFLQKGEKQSAHIMNGLPMLIGQAEASWKIWNT